MKVDKQEEEDSPPKRINLKNSNKNVEDSDKDLKNSKKNPTTNGSIIKDQLDQDESDCDIESEFLIIHKTVRRRVRSKSFSKTRESDEKSKEEMKSKRRSRTFTEVELIEDFDLINNNLAKLNKDLDNDLNLIEEEIRKKKEKEKEMEEEDDCFDEMVDEIIDEITDKIHDTKEEGKLDELVNMELIGKENEDPDKVANNDTIDREMNKKTKTKEEKEEENPNEKFIDEVDYINVFKDDEEEKLDQIIVESHKGEKDKINDEILQLFEKLEQELNSKNDGSELNSKEDHSELNSKDDGFTNDVGLPKEKELSDSNSNSIEEKSQSGEKSIKINHKSFESFNNPPLKDGGEEEKSLPEIIAQEVESRLNSMKNLPQSISDSDNVTTNEKHTLEGHDLAAIILTDESRLGWTETVCITSGSSVIVPTSLELNGNVLIDSRAIVLARRCLIRYLLSQINNLVTNSVSQKDALQSSILTQIAGSNRFKLKNGIKINLFMSEANERRQTQEKPSNPGEENDHTIKSSKSLESLHLKDIPDKIAIWNQAGLQGAMLSNFIDPIYIDSLIIASSDDDVNSFKTNSRLIRQHFTLNYTKDPRILKTRRIRSKMEASMDQVKRRQQNGEKQRGLACNWIQNLGNSDEVEVIDTSSGKVILDGEDGKEYKIASRLSKRQLFIQFKSFLSKYERKLRPEQQVMSRYMKSSSKASKANYRHWKECAPNYGMQKQLLKVRHVIAGRKPSWSMPKDVDMFC